MQLLSSSFGALSVAMIYYAYRDYVMARRTQHHQLHERVTFLLWTVAEQMS